MWADGVLPGVWQVCTPDFLPGPPTLGSQQSYNKGTETSGDERPPVHPSLRGAGEHSPRELSCTPEQSTGAAHRPEPTASPRPQSLRQSDQLPEQ